MPPSSHPSFFKVLLNASAPHLPLPPDFMSFHLKNKIPNDMIIQSAKGGYSWRLKIKKIGEMYYFFNGWDKVVKDCKLGNRDFLVFTLVDHSTFKMVMYRPNECENVLKPKTKVEDVVVPRGDKAYDYDPFFTQVITATHRGVLRLPKEFVGLPGINDKGTVIIKNLHGEEWPLGVRLDTTYYSDRYYLSKGWSKFRKSNNLSEGDECVFKFIISEAKFCLASVTKKGQATTQLLLLPSSGIPATEVVEKRKRGRPRVHGGGGDMANKGDCVEVVKRPRGRPPKQKSVM